METALCTNCGEKPIRFVRSGECVTCYHRRYRTERAGEPRPRTPSLTACGYQSAHIKVRRWRGSASEHTCISCGEQAKQWAYQYGSPYEQEGLVNMASKTAPQWAYMKWSPDVNAYEPMCIPCHIAFDKRHRDE